MRFILIGLASLMMASCGGGTSKPTKVVECTTNAECSDGKVCNNESKCGCSYRADRICSSADDCGCGVDCGTDKKCAAPNINPDNCPAGMGKSGDACSVSNQGSDCCPPLECIQTTDPKPGPSGDGADAGTCGIAS